MQKESWNYITMNNINWNISDLNWQIKILRKYYPIGMEVELWENPNLNNIDINRSHKFIIIEYKKRSHYTLNVYDPIDTCCLEMHPGFFRPTKRYLRDKKLERILQT
ncbi:MAG: hypothetical protein HPY57_13510 [Ignavibacteria bacterium]|nr:hypothetical protein [Ignavibacteria bacterium]